MLFLELILRVGDERGEGELEEGMDGHSLGVDGGNAGRRHHHDALRRLVLEASEEGGLSCSCLTGKEEVGVGGLYYLPRKTRLLVEVIIGLIHLVALLLYWFRAAW